MNDFYTTLEPINSPFQSLLSGIKQNHCFLNNTGPVIKFCNDSVLIDVPNFVVEDM